MTAKMALVPQAPIVQAAASRVQPPPAMEEQARPVADRVRDLAAAGVDRSDSILDREIKTLLAEAPPASRVDFASAAGSWKVCHAPHIASLSKLALTTFEPIEYRITPTGGIASYVRYESKLFGGGWLCTDGTIANAADADVPSVKIVWDRIWWQPGGAADLPPTDPADGALREAVQAIGKVGFIEGLSVFPVRYLDDHIGSFDFTAFTVTAFRAESSGAAAAATAASSSSVGGGGSRGGTPSMSMARSTASMASAIVATVDLDDQSRVRSSSSSSRSSAGMRRRRLVSATAVLTAALMLSSPAAPALAVKDCYLDCTQNCNRVAPNSFKYCESSCGDYCSQEDRMDGLSGSKGSSSAEVGWASAYDLPSRITGQQRLVPYGEDKPPVLPGLPSGLKGVLKDAVGIP